MASDSQAVTALLTEHFRYTPLILLDTIINVVNELVFHAVNQLEKAFSNAPLDLLGFEPDASHANLDDEEVNAALEEARQKEVDLGIMQIETLLNATVDKDFDKFELYTLRNILSVGHTEDADLAHWVCLDHYRHLKLDLADKSLSPEAVQLQRRKLHETNKLNAMLKEEELRNAKVIAELSSLVGESSGLGFLVNRNAGRPLPSEMQQIMEQMPQIRTYLAQLQNSLATTSTRTERSELDVGSLKRRAYLDSQAVKALNRQGIEPDGAKSSNSFGHIATNDSVKGIQAVLHGYRPAD